MAGKTGGGAGPAAGVGTGVAKVGGVCAAGRGFSAQLARRGCRDRGRCRLVLGSKWRPGAGATGLSVNQCN